MGVGVGVVLGEGVGVGVGVGVAVGEGEGDGERVGLGVAVGPGLAVGVDVGVADGSAVGVAVGVGVGVGCRGGAAPTTREVEPRRRGSFLRAKKSMPSGLFVATRNETRGPSIVEVVKAALTSIPIVPAGTEPAIVVISVPASGREFQVSVSSDHESATR